MKGRKTMKTVSVNEWKKVLNELTDVPMFAGKFDRKNADPYFINGVATVMDYIAAQACEEDKFDRLWNNNRSPKEDCTEPVTEKDSKIKKYILIDITEDEPKKLYSDDYLECVLAFVEGIIYPKNLGDIIIDTDIFMDEIKVIRVRNYYGENYIEQMVKTETTDRINAVLNLMGYHVIQINM